MQQLESGMSGQSGSERGWCLSRGGGGVARGDEAALTIKTDQRLLVNFTLSLKFPVKRSYKVTSMYMLRLFSEIQIITTVLYCIQ